MTARVQWLRFWMLCGTLWLTTSGCALFLIGAGVAGGYAISNDTATATIDRNFDAVWPVVKDELQHMAMLAKENKTAGTLEAQTADKTRIWLTLVHVSDKGVKLSVKSRKNMFPRPQTAQQLMERVLKRF